MKRFVKRGIHKIILIMACAALLFGVHLGYSIITSNLIIGGSAKFLQGKIIVSLDKNGGVLNVETINAKINGTYENLPIPTKDYCDFTGWYTEESGGTLVTSTSNLATQNDHTLYARYESLVAPTITGGTGSNWVSSYPTISLETYGSAFSDVKNYEYYTTTSSTSPTLSTNANGTTSQNVIITTEGTSYTYYRTVSNNGAKSEWSNYQIVNLGYYNEYFGSGIASLYTNIYTTANKTTPLTKESGLDNETYSGNYKYSNSLHSKTSSYATDISGTPINSASSFSKISSGFNSYTLKSTCKNQWVQLYFHSAYSTTGATISGLTLWFDNGGKITIQKAYEYGYIEPLVIIASSSERWDFGKILSGGSTAGSTFSYGHIFFKLKDNISPMIGFSFNTNMNWWTNVYNVDGVAVYKYPTDFKISLRPLRD